jgi:polyhydroxyalkanoate synthesis regulator phasin
MKLKVNECEDCDRLAQHVNKVTENLRKHALVCQERIEALEKQVLNLEQRRVANENNQDDPEWY